MPDVSVFNIGGKDINVYDEQARTQSSSAAQKANEAIAKVTELEQLSRVEVSYNEGQRKITITVGTHSVE